MNKAKILNPTNVERLVCLGNLYLESNDLEAAKENFSEAMRLNPKSEEVIAGNAKVSLLIDDIDEALALIANSKPHDIASIFNTAAVLKSRNEKDFKSAMRLYELAIPVLEGKPKILSRIYFNMGLSFKKSDNKDKALELFEKSAELDPEFDKAKVQIHDLSKS